MDIFSVFLNFSLRDAVDILAVSAIFYVAFTILRESRSFTALRGLFIIIFCSLVVWMLAQVFAMTATIRVLENSLPLVVIFFVLLFQGELKKALTDFGQTSLFRPFLKTVRFDLDEVVKAAVRLAERRTGALIAIERRNSLVPYIEVGTPLEAQVSTELLRTLFAIQTPLHDGAVVIRNGRVAAAGCLFPLSENPRLPKDMGTRHRAAIGLTEQTDAIVVIVSEESGAISIAEAGSIERNVDAETLRARLQSLLDFQEVRDGKE